MEIFDFQLNESFLTGTGHPITIPKSQLSYNALKALRLNDSDITVVMPHGERFEAAMYHGEAGYGEYYQLRFTGADRTLPAYLRLHEQVFILLLNRGAHSYALLEYTA